MKVTITIDCNNAAFDEVPEQEVAAILRKLASELDNPYANVTRIALRDGNGNTVGEASFTN